MGLVGYSDSEGSDAEEVKPQPEKTSQPQKSKVEKVVSGNKIRINLNNNASISQPPNTDDFDADRPAKRAKPNSAFSGINSFLPAPKNLAKTGAATSDSNNKARGSGLRPGISLKTGAAPAFSRELPEVYEDSPHGTEDTDYDEFGRRVAVAPSASTIGESMVSQEGTIKPAGKPMMFKPLSVGRKPAKKKIPAQPTVSSPSGSKLASDGVPPAKVEPAAMSTAPQSVAVSKKKQSLFSNFQEESIPAATKDVHAEYQPEFLEDAKADRAFDSDFKEPAVQQFAHNSQPPQTVNQTQGNDLQTLATSLNLTAAQRRQLFGRDGAANATLANFNLAQEYSANNAAMQDEATQAPIHNPVRAIAPGKHSLQQLLNSANNQRDALEESFASAKRNKAAAGSKYGW